MEKRKRFLYECKENPDKCFYSTNDGGMFKRHLAFKHNINVRWHSCNIGECTKKFKQASDLKRHIRETHDIGDNECDFCGTCKYSKIEYKDCAGTHYICKTCYFKVTGKHSRAEHVWSKYLDNYDVVHAVGNDDSLKRLGGCQNYRPDRITIGLDLVELDECDEHQHRYNSGNYTCDEKRISDIYDEEGICGKTMIVTRFNPDTYKVHGGKQKTMNERLRNLVLLKRSLRKAPPKNKIHIYYLFYDKDNPRIAQNIPHTIIC